MDHSLPWGKSDEGLTHHLAHHMADVAACFEALCCLPVLRRRLETSAQRLLDEADIARLAVIAFLHDCGKLHPAFQARLPGLEHSWMPPASYGHSMDGAILLANDAFAEALQFPAMRRWGPGLVSLLRATFSHHGRPIRPVIATSPQLAEMSGPAYAPLSAARQIGALMPVWFPEAFAAGGAPLPTAPDFGHLFCGLVSLADWLGSTETLFRFVPVCDAAYMARARTQAARAVADIGLDGTRWRQAIAGRATFETLAPGRQPRPAQQAAGDWPLDDPLVILEAETGSGKTEAALFRFARLFEAGMVDSLYFALPTRAAARQIHERVHHAIGRLMGPAPPEAVLAVPGYPQVGDTTGQRLERFEVLWDDDPDEALRIARWAAESGRRHLAATIAVGTVDQAMLAALPVKHAHLRGAALSRSLLVIDEVHASDAYMTGVQTTLLKMHLDRGGHAMLMSATLGATARSRWLKGRRTPVPAFAEAVALPYPALHGRKHGLGIMAREGERSKAVAMSLVSGWSGAIAAAEAVSAARQGARVLVIRNTVAAARQTFAAVKAEGGGPLLLQACGGPALHHARFAAEDRLLLDRAVEQALSPDQATRRPGGVIVIGTQTLEQALDLDADLLITDLCPADVLLQRIGRLHRHGLARPEGFAVPRCLVLTPEDGLAPLATRFENGLGLLADGGGVYRNLPSCELTRRLVRDHPVWTIPAMNRLLVEGATHDERLAALRAEPDSFWAAYHTRLSGGLMAEAQRASSLVLDVGMAFTLLAPFGEDDGAVRTRLGAEGAVIAFAEPLPGPFGSTVSRIALPAHWPGLASPDPVPAISDGETLSFTVKDQTFRYTREGLMRAGKL